MDKIFCVQCETFKSASEFKPEHILPFGFGNDGNTDVLDFENNDNPFEERRIRIGVWQKLAVVDCDLNEEIVVQSEKLMRIGLRQKDASHIACAIYSKADYFVTTDKRILNKSVIGITIINPIDFVRRCISDAGRYNT